ncbi:Protein of unknown function [Gryllus bimaculatus]|nr:Protein of unknown function [Gryllus bimaculatus]
MYASLVKSTPCRGNGLYDQRPALHITGAQTRDQLGPFPPGSEYFSFKTNKNVFTSDSNAQSKVTLSQRCGTHF